MIFERCPPIIDTKPSLHEFSEANSMHKLDEILREPTPASSSPPTTTILESNNTDHRRKRLSNDLKPATVREDCHSNPWKVFLNAFSSQPSTSTWISSNYSPLQPSSVSSRRSTTNEVSSVSKTESDGKQPTRNLLSSNLLQRNRKKILPK